MMSRLSGHLRASYSLLPRRASASHASCFPWAATTQSPSKLATAHRPPGCWTLPLLLVRRCCTTPSLLARRSSPQGESPRPPVLVPPHPAPAVATRARARRTPLLTGATRHLSNSPNNSPISPSSRPRLAGEPATRDEAPQSNPSKPLSRRLEAAREQTRTVREKVKQSLTGLKTPRENIYNLPNLLTVSRLFAAPATAYLLLHDHHLWALALFAYAGVTDLVDGWLARKWHLQTVAGSVIDPMADKALMIILTVTLAIKGAIPVYLATLILGRDATLALAAIYYRYASLPAPKTFMRYWDFSLPSAEVHPTTVSKYNTFLQLILIGSTLALPVVTADGQYAGLLHSALGLSDAALRSGMTYFQYLVAGTTAWSGLSYAFLKKAVTILGEDEALKAKQGARGRAIIGVSFGGVVALAVWFAFTVDDEDGRWSLREDETVD